MIPMKLKPTHKRNYLMQFFLSSKFVIDINKNYPTKKGRQNIFRSLTSIEGEIAFRNIALPQWRKTQNIDNPPIITMKC